MKDLCVNWETQHDQALDPVDLFPEDLNRDFLTDIRSNWIATISAQPKATQASARAPRSPLQKQPVQVVKSIFVCIRRRIASLGRGVTGGLRTKTPGNSMLSFLSAVMMMAMLAFVVVANYLFNPSTISSAAQSNNAIAAPEKASPIATFLGLSNPTTEASSPDSAPGMAAPASNPGHAMDIDGNAAAAVANTAETSVQKAAIADVPPSLTDAAGAITHTSPNTGTLKLRPDASPSALANAASIAVVSSAQHSRASAQNRVVSIDPPLSSDKAISVDASPARYRGPAQSKALEVASPKLNSASAVVRASAAGPAAPTGRTSATVRSPVATNESTAANTPALVEIPQLQRETSASYRLRQAAAPKPTSNAASGAYQLEYLIAGEKSGHPIRIAVTATTLQFFPETADGLGTSSIPLARIISAQTDSVAVDGLHTLTIRFKDSKNLDSQIRFSDGIPAGGHSQATSLQLANLRSAIVRGIASIRTSDAKASSH